MGDGGWGWGVGGHVQYYRVFFAKFRDIIQGDSGIETDTAHVQLTCR